MSKLRTLCLYCLVGCSDAFYLQSAFPSAATVLRKSMLMDSFPSVIAASPRSTTTKISRKTGGRIPVRAVTSSSFSATKKPKEAYEMFAEKGLHNAHMSAIKIFHQSLMGGMYVGFGGLLALTASGGLTGIGAENPAIPKLTFAALFPVNLLLCLCTGGQLFTGNTGSVVAAKFEGLIEWKDVVKNLWLSLAGNALGCLLFAMAANYAGLLAGNTGALCTKMALYKCSYAFGPTLVKGILCNWMVALAVFLFGATNDFTGKMVAIWLPVSTFVGIGLEHSIANLFLFPAAIMIGADLTPFQAIVKNVVPAVLGNLIAGAFIVAASFSFQYGKLGQQPPLQKTGSILHQSVVASANTTKQPQQRVIFVKGRKALQKYGFQSMGRTAR